MIGWFLDRTTALVVVGYPQDPSGGPVPTPASTVVEVPCCVQQNTVPKWSGKESIQQRATAELAVFFGPCYSASPDVALAAVLALKVKDRFTLDDGRTVVLDGPAFDRSGRGELYETAGKYTT